MPQPPRPPVKSCHVTVIEVTMLRTMRKNMLVYLQRYGAPDSDFPAAEMILGELLGNVIRHAPGAVDVTLAWDDAHPELTISDRGRGMPEKSTAGGGIFAESGRGLFLVRQLSRGVQISTNVHGGAHVVVRLPIRKGSPAEAS